MVYSGEEIRPNLAQEDEDGSGEVLEGGDEEEEKEEGLEEGPSGDLDETEEE